MSLNFKHYLDKAAFHFISDAYNATGGFRDGSYLDQYARESDKKLEKRKAVAYYENHIKPAAERFTGYLFKKPPKREINHPLVKEFAEDCDWRNNSLDIFYANFAAESKARGCGLILVDMPRIAAENAAQQSAQRFYPYLISIPPESVYTFQTNQRGLFSEIGINSTYVKDGYEYPCIRYWNETKWWVSDGANVIEEGDHNLGVCPVLAFSEGIGWPYLGTFSQIAYLSKRIYNMRSELDEILRSQTFSLLTYQIPPEAEGSVNPTQIAETIGTNNMLTYPAGAPAFVAPPDGPATIYMNAIEKLERTVKEVGLDASASTNSRSNETGVALTIRFQTLNGSLISFARRMEDLERRVFDLVSMWLRIGNTTTVSWPKDFNVSDVAVEMATLKDMQATNFPEPVIQEKMEQIVNLDFSNLEDAERQALVDSIGDYMQADLVPKAPILSVEVPNDPSLQLAQNINGVNQ